MPDAWILRGPTFYTVSLLQPKRTNKQKTFRPSGNVRVLLTSDLCDFGIQKCRLRKHSFVLFQKAFTMNFAQLKHLSRVSQAKQLKIQYQNDIFVDKTAP